MKAQNEGRTRKLAKAKRAHKGGTFAAQVKRAQINKGFARVAKGSPMVGKVTVTIKKAR